MKTNWIASLIIAACIKALIIFPLLPEIISKLLASDISHLINILPEWKDVILLSLITWILLAWITKMVFFDNYETMTNINEASARVDEHLKDQGFGD